MFRSKQKIREMVRTQSETVSIDVQSTPFGDITTEVRKLEFPQERIRFDKFSLELQIRNGVKINQVDTKVLDNDFSSVVHDEIDVPRETTEDQPF